MADIISTLLPMLGGIPNLGEQGLLPTPPAAAGYPMPISPQNVPDQSAPSIADQVRGNVLARLSPGKGALQRAGRGMAGLSGMKETRDPWLAFANGFGGAQKALAEQDAADRKAAAEAEQRSYDRSQDTWKRGLTEKKTSREELESDARIKQGNRRLDLYEKHGGGKEQTPVDALYKVDQILKGYRSEQRRALGLDADDEALPTQKMPKEERTKREQQYNENVMKKERELTQQIPNLRKSPAVDDDEDEDVPAGQPASKSKPVAAPVAPQPAPPQAWIRGTDRRTGKAVDFNPATGESREIAPSPLPPPPQPAPIPQSQGGGPAPWTGMNPYSDLEGILGKLLGG